MVCFHDKDPNQVYFIHHYPTDLLDVWVIGNGTRLIWRPALPQDLPLLDAMIERLDTRTRHLRFNTTDSRPTAEFVWQMVNVNYQQRMSFVLTTGERNNERVVAEACYEVGPTGESAEFAMVVEDSWQRLGIGRRIIRAVSMAARSRGVHRLHATTSQDNQGLIALMHKYRFPCYPDRQYPERIHIEPNLDAIDFGLLLSPSPAVKASTPRPARTPSLPSDRPGN